MKGQPQAVTLLSFNGDGFRLELRYRPPIPLPDMPVGCVTLIIHLTSLILFLLQTRETS